MTYFNAIQVATVPCNSFHLHDKLVIKIILGEHISRRCLDFDSFNAIVDFDIIMSLLDVFKLIVGKKGWRGKRSSIRLGF